MTTRPSRNLALELEFEGVTYFVNAQTEKKCRERADSIYGVGTWKEIVITTAKEALCLN